jgi:hypothetical protein
MRSWMRQQPACKITALLWHVPDTSISQGILRKTVTKIAASCPEYWRFLPFDGGGNDNRKTCAVHPLFYYHFFPPNNSFMQVLQGLLAHLQTAAHQPGALVFHSISYIFEGGSEGGSPAQQCSQLEVCFLAFIFCFYFFFHFSFFIFHFLVAYCLIFCFHFLFSSGFSLLIRAACGISP